MKNYIQGGDTLVLTAPANKTSGQGVLVGSIFGVAVHDAASGAALSIKTTGCYELTKVGSQAWTVGAPIYWDNANSRCTNVDEDTVLIGVAIEAVGSGANETLGKVRLNGSFGHPVINDVA